MYTHIILSKMYCPAEKGLMRTPFAKPLADFSIRCASAAAPARAVPYNG